MLALTQTVCCMSKSMPMGMPHGIPVMPTRSLSMRQTIQHRPELQQSSRMMLNQMKPVISINNKPCVSIKKFPTFMNMRLFSTKTYDNLSVKKENIFVKPIETQQNQPNERVVEVNDGFRDVGLKKFMSKVYSKMALGVASSLGISLLLMPVTMVNPLATLGIGFLTSMAGVIGINYYKPKYQTCYVENELIHYSENEPMREASFWCLTGGMGVMMSPLIGMMMAIDPTIVPLSVVLSSMVFGGCAYYATVCKDTQMMKWKAPLTIGLTSLIAIQLVGIASILLSGPNVLSNLIHNVDVYGGIGLFTMMSIYDSYMARKMYKSKQADHLGCATQVYLDFMNLLIRIMEAMAKAKK